MANARLVPGLLTGLGLSLLGCSVSIGTSQPKEPASGQLQGSPQDTAEPEATTKPQVVTDDEEDAKLEAAQAKREEAEEQRQCKAELLELRRQKGQQAHASGEREALASCADSGLPPGTYRTNGGLPHVEVQVTESGCAAYEAFAFHEGTNTRRFVTEHGTREIEYEQGYECTVGGVLDANRRPYHSRWQGNGCRRKILDVVSEGVAWKVNGTTITATANVAGGKRPVTLQRLDSSTSGWEGGSPLWKKQRTESDEEATVSVALTPIPPQPDPDHNWCFDLQMEKSANR